MGPAIMSARRSLSRLRAELRRARKLGRAAARRFAAVPWKKLFSLAAWLGLVQQPRMWLAAAAAAAAQFLLAMLFLGGSPTTAEKVGSNTRQRAGGHADRGVAVRGGLQRAKSPQASLAETGTTADEQDTELDLDARPSHRAGPTTAWGDDGVPRTARRPATQGGRYAPQADEPAPQRQPASVHRPGSVRLQGIVQEEGLSAP